MESSWEALEVNLFGIDDIGELDRKDIARRQLNNLLTSYADEADLFNEVLQNALDAMLLAGERELYQEDNPVLTVILGRRRESYQYLFVGDNGIGMSPSTALSLTVPGFSEGKKKGKTLGYKGVGASYFFAASKRAALRTVDSDGERVEYTVLGSHSWILDPEEPEPSVEEEFDVPEFVSKSFDISRGTGILYQFHEGVYPHSLDHTVKVGKSIADELVHWANYLCARTVLGAVESLFSKPLKIRLILDRGEEQAEQFFSLESYDIEKSILGYPFPHKILRTSKDTDEIDGVGPEKRYSHNRRYSAVRKRWKADEIIPKLRSLTEGASEKLERHLDWVDAYLCYSTEIMKECNDRLGGRSQFLRHGIKIAVDGIPQGRMLDLSLTSSQGLDRQSHIVISFKGLELDLGRKISADEDIANAISEVGKHVVGHLKEYRWALKKKDRPDVSSDLSRWKEAIDSRQVESVYVPFCEALNLSPVFAVDPDNEQEVIALFVSLCASGSLLGYDIRAISGFERYDAIVNVSTSSDDLKRFTDPVSIRTDEDQVAGENCVLEFKHSFIDLMHDFAEKKKNPMEVDLLVCWELNELNVDRGRVRPCYEEWRDHRPNYGASYIWEDDNESSSVVIISLKNFVLELLASAERKAGESDIGVGHLARLVRRDRDQLL